jgi:cytochrome P450
MYSGYYEEGIAWVYSKLRYPTMRGWKFCVGFYAREGFGTRREFFPERLRYTEMVLKESMRLYPTVWGTVGKR